MMEVSRKVNTILNCFVDINLETNERFPYDVQLLNVSFLNSSYQIDEDSMLNVEISLSQESTQGIEEADLILSHINTEREDIGNVDFPIRIKWQIGERNKVISIPIPRDFVEDGDESFMLGLTNLLNLRSGQIMQSNVLILDTTVLRTVRISNPRANVTNRFANGTFIFNSTNNGRSTGLNTTTSYTIVEGDQITITIGLDAPSQFGIEKVEVSISNNIDISGLEIQPSVFLNSTLLEWNVGEQYKSVTISTGRDGISQGNRRMLLELANPIGVKLHSEQNYVDVTVQDPPVARRYTLIDFGRIFKQRGSDITPSTTSQNSNLQLRIIPDGQNTNPTSLYWFVELGTFYTDESNNPDINESVNYSSWPNYSFGVNENGVPEGVYLKVTNIGTGDITYNGQQYNVGESFLVTMGRGETSIILPTNDLQQPEGSIVGFDNTVLTESTFTVSMYRFEIVVEIPQLQLANESTTSGPHGFILKTNSPNANSYLIGEFTLENHVSIDEAMDNPMGLYSSYTNMRTRFNGVSCTNSFDGDSNVRDIMIHGIALLSRNSLGTDYLSHNILPMNGRFPICGTSSGSVNGITWLSIPFENN